MISKTPERFIIIILSALLLAGAVMLHIRHNRPYAAIEITKDGLKEQLTPGQVERRLRDSRRVNINAASAEELTAIPGVGEVTAARIVAFRSSHGSFETEADLMLVEGIGPAKFEKMKDFIEIE